MSRAWRPVLVGVVSAAVLLAVWWRPDPPRPAWAQGVGIFVRASCTQITSPVSGATFCLEGASNTLKVWNGSTWITNAATQTGVTSVKDYGAVGNGTTDDTASIQAAINAATASGTNGVILLPPGTYRVTSTINFTRNIASTGLRLIGAGMHTSVIASAVANGPAIRLDNASNSLFPVGGELAQFGIVQTGTPVSSHGIEVRGTWLSRIANVRVATMTGDGLRITNSGGDADSTSKLIVQGSQFVSNGGWGVNVNNEVGINSVSLMEIDSNVITGNTSGGLRLQALNFTVSHNSIAQNGGQGGIHVRVSGTGNQNGRIVNNSFETNAEQHIKIDGLLSGLIAHNSFYHFDDGPGYRPQRGIILGDGTNTAENIWVQSNLVRATPASPTVTTTFVIASSTSSNNKILDTSWQAFTGVHAVRYTDAGTLTTIMDDGNFTVTNGITAPRLQISGTGVTSAGLTIRTNGATRWNVYAPSNSTDLLFEDGAIQPVVTLSAAGALQVGTPSGTNTGAGTINVASATFMNGGAVLVASGSSANLTNVRGIAATQTRGNNLRGQCIFAAAATCAVAFANNEPNAAYFITVGCSAAAAANVHPVSWDAKTVSGFTLRASVSNSNTCDWHIIR